MSNGGLLEKAAKQQTGNADLGHTTPSGSSEPSRQNDMNSNSRLAMLILGGMVVPYFIVMWFGGIFIGENAGYLSAAVLFISGGAIWISIGRPAPASLPTIAVGMSFILLLSSNFAIALLLTGEMSLGQIEHDEETDELVLKIRQNGGSGTYDASVTITQGSYSYTSTSSLTIDKEDGQGDYGWLKIPIQAFYNENALPDSEYRIIVEIDGNTWERNLDSNALSRTLTGVDVTATPSFKTQDCEGSTKDRCLSGVALDVTAGLLGSSQEFIAAMPFADYDLDVVMTYEGSDSIDYPVIEVRHTTATWLSVGGEYGSGSAYIGDSGPSMRLGGSTVAQDIDRSVILKEDWMESGFGCYSLTIVGQNLDPWSTESIQHTSYYLYEETNLNDAGQYTSESWNAVQSC
ncbi:MAG: hypothetical protein ACPGQG_02105 [Candidatus Thalassarchaeaceae archaeon]